MKPAPHPTATLVSAAPASRGASVRVSRRAPPIETPLLEPALDTLDGLEADALAIGVTTDLRPLVGAAGFVDWRLCGEISRLLQRGIFRGEAGEKALISSHGRLPVPRVFLFGFGPNAEVLACAEERMAWMVAALQDARVSRVAIALPEPVRPLLGRVDEHLLAALGETLVGVFDTDRLWAKRRPITLPPTYSAVQLG